MIALVLVATAQAMPAPEWVNLAAEGRRPVYVDVAGIRRGDGEAVVRLRYASSGGVLAEVWIDLAIACASRRTEIRRTAEVRDGAELSHQDYPPGEGREMALGAGPGDRLHALACTNEG